MSYAGDRIRVHAHEAGWQPLWRWRSLEESRLLRMFVWQWMLGRGPQCSRYALAKWLGVGKSYAWFLHKTLPKDAAEYEREVARSGAPTLEALRAARERSRSLRARGQLQLQSGFKEIHEPVTGRVKVVPTKPNAVTLALDGKIPLQPPGRERRKGGRPKKKRTGRCCSAEQSRENLKKAWANHKPPRRWRSPSESRLVRMFVWQWVLGRGPHCSVRALAKWLGVSRAWVNKLRKRLPVDEAAFLAEVARTGIPTLEALKGARQDSRYMRELGLLLTQRPYKPVKCEWNGHVHYETVHTKPNAVTLALDGEIPLAPPSRVEPGQAAPDEFTTRMWLLRMKEERKRKDQAVMPRRWRRRYG
jgi:hypothetical protein